MASVLQTAAHELGHSLGLMHTPGADDLMHPYLNSLQWGHINFSRTDIKKITAKYGVSERHRQTGQYLTSGDECGNIASYAQWVPGHWISHNDSIFDAHWKKAWQPYI